VRSCLSRIAWVCLVRVRVTTVMIDPHALEGNGVRGIPRCLEPASVSTLCLVMLSYVCTMHLLLKLP